MSENFDRTKEGYRIGWRAIQFAFILSVMIIVSTTAAYFYSKHLEYSVVYSMYDSIIEASKATASQLIEKLFEFLKVWLGK